MSHSDNLRDRIAAITARLIREEIDIDPVWLIAQHVADAVIRELGMRQQFLGESIGRPQSDTYRYVTEWTADE